MSGARDWLDAFEGEEYPRTEETILLASGEAVKAQVYALSDPADGKQALLDLADGTP